jgi:hypothetical protein
MIRAGKIIFGLKSCDFRAGSGQAQRSRSLLVALPKQFDADGKGLDPSSRPFFACPRTLLPTFSSGKTAGRPSAPFGDCVRELHDAIVPLPTHRFPACCVEIA